MPHHLCVLGFVIGTKEPRHVPEIPDRIRFITAYHDRLSLTIFSHASLQCPTCPLLRKMPYALCEQKECINGMCHTPSIVHVHLLHVQWFEDSTSAPPFWEFICAIVCAWRKQSSCVTTSLSTGAGPCDVRLSEGRFQVLSPFSNRSQLSKVFNVR